MEGKGMVGGYGVEQRQTSPMELNAIKAFHVWLARATPGTRVKGADHYTSILLCIMSFFFSQLRHMLSNGPLMSIRALLHYTAFSEKTLQRSKTKRMEERFERECRAESLKKS